MSSQKRLTTWLVLVLVVVAIAAVWVVKNADAPTEAPVARAEADIVAGLPTLVDLGSDECPSCIEMKPVLAGLHSELDGKANVVFIDVKKDTTAGQRYGIQFIPTQIYFDASGNEVHRNVGAVDRDALLEGLEMAGLTR